MVCNNVRKGFLSYLFISFVLFLSLYAIIFTLSGMLFIVELLFLIISVVIVILILRSLLSRRKWTCGFLMIFFSFQLLNMLNLCFVVEFNKAILPLIMAVLGLLLSFMSDKRRQVGRSKKRVIPQSYSESPVTVSVSAAPEKTAGEESKVQPAKKKSRKKKSTSRKQPKKRRNR